MAREKTPETYEEKLQQLEELRPMSVWHWLAIVGCVVALQTVLIWFAVWLWAALRA